jgi:hypothetical protein
MLATSPSLTAVPVHDGAAAPTSKVAEAYHPFRRVLRCHTVGMLFGVAFGASAPMSPMFRRAVSKGQSKESGMLIGTGTALAYLGSSVSYACFVDPGAPSAAVLPVLGPVTAVVPGIGAFAVCSMAYPGLYVMLNEPGGRGHVLREVGRITLKMTAAHLPSHVPVALAWSVFIGGFIYPLRSKAE